MTVRVLGLESGVTSLEDHRHLVSLFQGLGPSGVLERRSGIVPSDGAADLTTASAMQADIAAFVAWIDGTSSALQAGYPFVSDATETLTFSDGDATNDRIDRVVAQIRDNTYDASGFTDGRVVIVEGTPAGTPVAPALPDSSIPLFRVPVAAGTSAGSGGIDFGTVVTDEREFTAALGGVLVVTAGIGSQSDWPSAPVVGQLIWSITDAALYVWAGSWEAVHFGTAAYARLIQEASGQSTANNTLEQASFNTVDRQNDPGFGSTGSQLTIPHAGYFDIRCRFTWDTTENAGSVRYLQLQVDGIAAASDKMSPFTGAVGLESNHVFYSDYFDGGEIITAWIFQDSGGAISADPQIQAYLEIRERLEF